MGELRFGCSGWDYEAWMGTLYRPGDRSKLRAYSLVFDTAEINSTFYRLPSEGMVMGWLRYSPDDFVFCAKLPKTVTHELKLKGAKGEVEKYCDLMRRLNDAGKLGCSLIQLPPFLRFIPDVVERFFETLPEDYNFAIEFRHPSWLCEESWGLLKKYDVSYVAVDEPLLPPDIEVTSKIGYVRWHGRGRETWYNYRYSMKELEGWLPKIEQMLEECETVFGYFNNHYHGYAPENCLEVLELLGKLTPQQKEAMKRVKAGIDGKVETIPKAKGLDLYLKTDVDNGLEALLLRLTDQERIDRSAQIEPKDIALCKVTGEYISADIKSYRLVIDLGNRQLRHNCVDFYNNMERKRLCKHVVRILRTVPRETAIAILKSLTSEIEKWEFKRYWDE